MFTVHDQFDRVIKTCATRKKAQAWGKKLRTGISPTDMTKVQYIHKGALRVRFYHS